MTNLHDFAGMLVFDKWTCNTNGRQTLFVQEPLRGGPAGRGRRRRGITTGPPYSTLMIDQGFCFQCRRMGFSRRAAARAVRAKSRLRRRHRDGIVRALARAPGKADDRARLEALDEITRQIPPAWYDDDYDALLRLLPNNSCGAVSRPGTDPGRQTIQSPAVSELDVTKPDVTHD